jgi:hypothetical protein
MDEYISLLRTQGATTSGDPGAGANLVGTAGISGVTPTGKSVGGDANLQQMLEGLAAYTDSQIAAFDLSGAVTVTSNGTTNTLPKFTAGQVLGDSSITDTGTAVAIGATLDVGGTLTVKRIGTGGGSTSSLLIMQVGGGSYQTSLVATAAGNNLALELPSSTGITTGTVLADFSIIDCGDYDA